MINRRLSSKMVFEGRIINLRVDEVELPDGRRSTREIIEHPGAVVIVPLDDEEQIHLVKQYRDAVEETLLELPAGKLDGGEDPEDCARRELKEELGFEAKKWRRLAEFYSSPGFCNEILYVYMAMGLVKSENVAEGEEFIEAVSRPFRPVDSLAAEMKDGKSIVGIYLAHHALQEGPGA